MSRSAERAVSPTSPYIPATATTLALMAMCSQIHSSMSWGCSRPMPQEAKSASTRS